MGCRGEHPKAAASRQGHPMGTTMRHGVCRVQGGRKAMKPAELWQLLKETAAAWYEDKTSQLGAALAYYAVFAVAPLAVIAVAVAGMVFGEQAARGELSQQVARAFGPTVGRAIEDIVKQIHQE